MNCFAKRFIKLYYLKSFYIHSTLIKQGITLQCFAAGIHFFVPLSLSEFLTKLQLTDSLEDSHFFSGYFVQD